MNILQTLQASREFCVTLNRTEAIDPKEIKARFTYHHPVFSTRAPEAQKRHDEISGLNRTHFCGAYWGYGFHEDGVQKRPAGGPLVREGTLTVQSGIYTGHVRHRRFLPVENSFRYALFLVFADLAEMEQAFRASPFWSVDRFNLACFLKKGPLRRPRHAA